MIEVEKMPPATEGNLKTSAPNVTNKPKGKLDRMLALFAKGFRMNTFQAKDVGDTCLHSTISALQVRHGILFSREWQSVHGRFGLSRVRCYWLEGDHLAKARKVVQSPSVDSR